MAGLDSLTTGSSAATDGNIAQQTSLPDWYNSYIQGIASKATDIASTPYQAYPGERLADFNDDQQNAFQTIRDAQGNYQPALTQASGALGSALSTTAGALGQAQQAAGSASSAVAGPSANWTDPGVAAQYMSPYTSSVVNEIGRLGNQNLMENVIPQTQANFVGSGQFGSSRNATILGNAIRDTQAGITGQQSTALQAGYTGAEGQFNADANRTQQQGALQANTALGTASADNSTASTAANAGASLGAQYGALGSLQQQLSANDATELGAVGGQEQALQQTGDTTAYNDFLNQQNWDWSQLGKVQNAVSGVQLPTGTTASTSTSTTPAGTSPLAWLSSISGLYNAANSTATPGTATSG